MTTQMRTTNIIATAVVITVLAITTAGAAEKGKKLYCWNENGRKVCGDALPPEAAESARTEISARSGLQTGQVSRALTGEERAVAASAAEQAQLLADAEAARLRRDLAMVESYDSEDELRHAYGERINLVDSSLKTSELAEANLRHSLVALLGQAGDQELAGKPVVPALLANIRSQHEQLMTALRIAEQQRRDRVALDSELASAVERYRALKHPVINPAETTSPPQG